MSHLDVRDRDGKTTRRIKMVQAAQDLTKWHLAESFTLGTHETAALVIDGQEPVPLGD